MHYSIIFHVAILAGSHLALALPGSGEPSHDLEAGSSGTSPSPELAAKYEESDEQYRHSEILMAKNKHRKQFKCVRVHHHEGMKGKEDKHKDDEKEVKEKEDEKEAKEKEDGEYGKHGKHGKLYRCYPAQKESDGHEEEQNEESNKIGVTKLGPDAVLIPSPTTSTPTQTNTAASDSAVPGPTRRRGIAFKAARHNIEMPQKYHREEEGRRDEGQF